MLAAQYGRNYRPGGRRGGQLRRRRRLPTWQSRMRSCNWVDGFGVTHVTCDPSNLKTTKISKGDCVPAGDGFRCEYMVTVKNMGPDPYHGPIKLGEQLASHPHVGNVLGAWGCSAAAPATSARIRTSNRPKARQRRARRDRSSCRPASSAQLINRAATIFPVAGTRYNNKTGDDVGGGNGQDSSPKCEKPDRPRAGPENELRTESGACVCKTGFMRDRKHVCISIFEPTRCPDGSPIPKNGRLSATDADMRPRSARVPQRRRRVRVQARL